MPEAKIIKQVAVIEQINVAHFLFLRTFQKSSKVRSNFGKRNTPAEAIQQYEIATEDFVGKTKNMNGEITINAIPIKKPM